MSIIKNFQHTNKAEQYWELTDRISVRKALKKFMYENCSIMSIFSMNLSDQAKLCLHKRADVSVDCLHLNWMWSKFSTASLLFTITGNIVLQNLKTPLSYMSTETKRHPF